MMGPLLLVMSLRNDVMAWKGLVRRVLLEVFLQVLVSGVGLVARVWPSLVIHAAKNGVLRHHLMLLGGHLVKSIRSKERIVLMPLVWISLVPIHPGSVVVFLIHTRFGWGP